MSATSQVGDFEFTACFAITLANMPVCGLPPRNNLGFRGWGRGVIEVIDQVYAADSEGHAEEEGE